MAEISEIEFYDIASGPPVRTFAPNPWKTRYALNFKRANYKTCWVEYPDVTKVRKELGAPPNRTLPNGDPFYTLPVIKIQPSGEVVGDSFDIAVHLDKMYPEAPPLCPPNTIGLLVAFNVQVDAIFTNHVRLMALGQPFNPDTIEATKKTLMARYNAPSWESFGLFGEERAQSLRSFQTALGDLAKAYRRVDGLFLEGGQNPTYADIIVAAWLQFVMATTPEAKEVLAWHDGLWGRLIEGMKPYATIK